MRNFTIFFTILIVIFLASCASIPSEGVKVMTDDFTGESRTVGKMMLQPESLMGKLVAATYNVAHTDSGKYLGWLDATSAGWFFFEKMAVKLDSADPVTFDSVEHDRDVQSGKYVRERVYFTMSREELKSVAASNTVKLRFTGTEGKYDVELTEENMSTLREFLAATE